MISLQLWARVSNRDGRRLVVLPNLPPLSNLEPISLYRVVELFKVFWTG